jgi:hypothetical protein
MEASLRNRSSPTPQPGLAQTSGCVPYPRIQENALGGLKPATRRLLERVAEDARARKPTKVVPTRKVGPDTILIREWGGTRHEVTIVENGVMFRGKRHRSLSQVARIITGSQWSGPLFFGLKAPAKEAGNGARQ